MDLLSNRWFNLFLCNVKIVFVRPKRRLLQRQNCTSECLLLLADSVVTNTRNLPRNPSPALNVQRRIFNGRRGGFQEFHRRGHNRPYDHRGPMRRGGRPANRGPRRGRYGNQNRAPLNESQLDAQLDKYFEKV